MTLYSHLLMCHKAIIQSINHSDKLKHIINAIQINKFEKVETNKINFY